MIEEMRIRDLGVIAEAVVEFGSGLTVVTGETGAGKTMILTGLALLCGGRADATRVRTGRRQAVVDGRLRLPGNHPSVRAALEAGAELDEDGSLLVTRIVGSDGRSRAIVGGRAIPGGLLARLMADVVAVHGQSTQAGLLRPTAARAALDRYAGLAGPSGDGTFERFVETYREWRAAVAEVEDRAAHARERAREAELLRLGLAEIDRIAPEAGEEIDLDRESDVLSHAEELRSAAESARAALVGDDDNAGTSPDALSLVTAARRSLAAAGSHDPDLDGLGSRAQEVASLVADLGADLASYADRVDTDPSRLQVVEDRRAQLRSLQRRYGETNAEVLAWAEASRSRLADLDDSEDALTDLRRRRDDLGRSTGELAAELRMRRSGAAARLGAATTSELAGLAMGSARLEVVVTPRDARAAAPTGSTVSPVPQPRAAAIGDGPAIETATSVVDDLRVLPVAGTPALMGSDGADDVDFRMVPHPGVPVRPIAKVASGGELSRVMLALELVFASVTAMPLLVFDEVDAGIGGTVGVEVGRRLAELARRHQVVCVTHLAQVAAFADTHLTVRKSTGDSVTSSDVRSLPEADRVVEISRMLGGLADSGSGREHAEELRQLAARGTGDG